MMLPYMGNFSVGVTKSMKILLLENFHMFTPKFSYVYDLRLTSKYLCNIGWASESRAMSYDPCM